jgi:hypothetical protein
MRFAPASNVTEARRRTKVKLESSGKQNRNLQEIYTADDGRNIEPQPSALSDSFASNDRARRSTGCAAVNSGLLLRTAAKISDQDADGLAP